MQWYKQWLNITWTSMLLFRTTCENRLKIVFKKLNVLMGMNSF